MNYLRPVYLGFFIAAAFWFIMFSPWTAGWHNFWILMLVATANLMALSFFFGKDELAAIYKFKFKWVLYGLVGATVLYGIFWLGNEISQLLFDFTARQVDNIYSSKEQGDRLFIGAALLLWIGPAEEIFWRGFAQHRLMNRFGDMKGFIYTTIVYAIVHIWAFNFILFMAALICGIFWGWLYMKYKNIWPGIISHAVWDVTIFVIFPIN